MKIDAVLTWLAVGLCVIAIFVVLSLSMTALQFDAVYRGF